MYQLGGTEGECLGYQRVEFIEAGACVWCLPGDNSGLSAVCYVLSTLLEKLECGSVFTRVQAARLFPRRVVQFRTRRQSARVRSEQARRKNLRVKDPMRMARTAAAGNRDNGLQHVWWGLGGCLLIFCLVLMVWCLSPVSYPHVWDDIALGTVSQAAELRGKVMETE